MSSTVVRFFLLKLLFPTVLQVNFSTKTLPARYALAYVAAPGPHIFSSIIYIYTYHNLDETHICRAHFTRRSWIFNVVLGVAQQVLGVAQQDHGYLMLC